MRNWEQSGRRASLIGVDDGERVEGQGSESEAHRVEREVVEPAPIHRLRVGVDDGAARLDLGRQEQVGIVSAVVEQDLGGGIERLQVADQVEDAVGLLVDEAGKDIDEPGHQLFLAAFWAVFFLATFLRLMGGDGRLSFSMSLRTASSCLRAASPAAAFFLRSSSCLSRFTVFGVEVLGGFLESGFKGGFGLCELVVLRFAGGAQVGLQTLLGFRELGGEPGKAVFEGFGFLQALVGCGEVVGELGAAAVEVLEAGAQVTIFGGGGGGDAGVAYDSVGFDEGDVIGRPETPGSEGRFEELGNGRLFATGNDVDALEAESMELVARLVDVEAGDVALYGPRCCFGLGLEIGENVVENAGGEIELG